MLGACGNLPEDLLLGGESPLEVYEIVAVGSRPHAVIPAPDYGDETATGTLQEMCTQRSTLAGLTV